MNAPRILVSRLAVLLLVASGSVAAQTITEFPVPPHSPREIVTGTDGNLWYTMINSAPAAMNIARMTPAGVVTEFPLATPPPKTSYGIAAGPDGNIWFTYLGLQIIGRIVPSTTVITEFPIPANGYGITAGPDGALWFTEGDINKIGRITTSGGVTEFTIPTASTLPRGITTGSDGNVWFMEAIGNNVGRLVPATGVITEFPIPTAGAQAQQIVAGSDGNLWFCEIVASKIGRITTAGLITEFPIVGGCQFITSGPDGALWFTGGGGSLIGNRIGRITTTGVATYTPIPTLNSGSESITVGPDGALWFTEQNVNQIGRVALPPPVLASAVSRKVHGAAGTFDLPLSLVPTAPTTEPRQSAAATIVFSFGAAITAANVAVTEGTATAGAPTFSGNDVIVGLTGVTDQQYVSVNLTNVASGAITGGSGSVRVGFLVGDVNQTRVVTVADLGLVNAQLAQVVTASNFTRDVNASGTLTLADKGITNANLTKALPPP